MPDKNIHDEESRINSEGKLAVGYVKFTQGVVLATNSLGQARELLPGDLVFLDETISTAESGFIILGGFIGGSIFLPEDNGIQLTEQDFNNVPIPKLHFTENLTIGDFLVKLFSGTLSESLEEPALLLHDSFQTVPALAISFNTNSQDIFNNLKIDAADITEQTEDTFRNVKDNLEKLGVRLENFANLENNLLDVADSSGIETPPGGDTGSGGSPPPVPTPEADLSVTITIDNATPDVGDNVTFTLTVIDNGPSSANNVVLTDILPAGFTYVSANPSVGSYDENTGVWDGYNLGGGGSATLEIVATVNDHNALNNIATVTSDVFDPALGNNTDNQIVDALDANLSISKAVDNATPDLGDNITFTLTVVNNGPDASNNISVTDLLPAGFTFVSSNPSAGSYDDGSGVWDGFNLANGGSATLEIVATVTDHNALNNIASVDADTFDPVAGNDTDNQIVNALDADLSISKAVNNATPDVGDNITFTLTVVNSGPDASNNISVTDLLPAGFTFVSSNPSVGSYDDGTGVWDGFNLANGGSATLEIVATVTDHNALNNIASVDADTFDPNAGNDSDNQIVNALDADLSISKAVNNATPDVGDNITFTLTVINNGPDASNNISVTDLLPAGFTFVSSNPSAGSYDDGTGVWDGFNLANGGSATLEIVATVTDHNALNNIASVDADTFDPNAGNDTDNQIVDALDADLSISKAVNNATPDVGDNITFTLTVINNGPDASNNISVTDLLPAGFTFVSSNPSVGSYNDGSGVWDGFNLANGGSATLEIVATVTDHNAINNIASVDADTFDPNAANDSDNQIVDALDADLSISKAVNNATPDVGDNITFTLTVINNGPDASNNISVTDLLPAGFTFVSSNPSVGSYNDGSGVWDGFNLANGANATLEIVATVTDHNAINNIASVDADTFDPNAGNDTDNQIVDALDADLSISKAVDNATPDVGDNITFTLTVVNSGPDASNNISVTDLLPAGFTFVSSNPSIGSYDDGSGVWDGFNLANGGSATLEIVATVTDHNALNNIASVDADTFDPNAANDSDNQIVDALDADLSISKAVDNATPDVGDNITFTLTVINNGPDASNNVSVADLLPAGFTFVSSNPSVGSYDDGSGVWDGFNLANGGSATLEIVATVTDHNALNNIASVDADTFDPNAANDSDNQIVDALDADLSISKAVDNATPDVGDNITFTLTVVNSGPDASNNVSVTDLLPAGFTFVSSNPSVGSYDDGTGVWDGFNLANGANATLEIVATVTDHNAINNIASVDADTFDPNAANDSDNQIVDALDADLSISKAVNNATPDVGDNITFTLTVVNNGPDASNNISVTDLLPAGFTFVSSNPSIGSYDDGSGVWDGFNLANGGSATLEIVATVTDHNALNNIATVDADTFDPNAGNDSDNQIVDALDADLSISKAVDNATPDVGDNITFTLTVVNNGPDASNNISVTDLLPAGFTFVSSNPSAGSYDDGSGVWDGFNLANGGSATLEIVATVTDHNALNNIASVDADTFDPNAGNDTDNQIVDALDADLSISKAVNNVTPDVGDNITFTLTVVNNGPDASNNISVTDLLPAGFTFVSSNPSAGSYDDGSGVWDGFNLANGGSATLEIVATVTDHNALNNIATVDADTFDPNAGNDSDNQIVDALDADLSISKAVNNATPDVGDNITFTLTVVNSGPDASNNISVTDLLPAGFTFVSSNPSVGSYDDGTGVWDGFNLANGGSATLEIVATVTDHNALNNIATVDADTFDPNAGNDSDNQIVDALDADLSISKAVDNATPDVGDNITFTLTVVNSGPDASNNVSVTDLLPAGFTFVSSNPSAGSYDDGTGVWDGFNLANGGSATLEIVATVTDHNALNNIATVDADTFDPNAGNDSDNQIVDALDADLSISKAVNNATPDVGDNIIFTLTVVNSGPDASNNVSVTDLLPAGFTFVSSNPSAGSYDDGTGVWDGFSLANGANATLEIEATVTDHNAINNIATVDADTFDPVAGNDTDNQIVNAVDADLSISKAVNNATPDVGDNITFTLTVVNSGPDASNNVSVTDLLPAGFTFVSSNPSVGSYDDGTGVWDGFNLANGGSATLEIVATVTDHNALNNIATVDADTFDPNAGNDTDNQIVNALDADLSISKAVNNATPDVGDNIIFTLTVTNNGPDASNNISVTDLLPAGFTFVSSNLSVGSYDDGTGVWDGFSLANGANATLEIEATVTDHNAINNIATVNADTFDPNAANDSDNQIVDALDADLSISKAVNNATPDVGDNITFTLTVVNSGPDTSNNISVTDLLPAGFTFVSSNPSVGSYDDGTGVWDGFNLVNGGSATLEIVATVTDHNALNNIATVDADTFDPVAGNDTDNQIVDALDADLSISKAVDNATPDVGDNITFTLTVVNSGPDASNNISVTDLLPAGFTFVSSNPSAGSYDDGTGVWDGFNLANGANATLEIVATVTDHNALNNIATVDADTFDPNAGNDTDNQIVDALDADLSISKAVNNATPDVGDNITFTLTVVNSGPDASNNISVTDLLPAGFTFVSSNPSVGSYNDGTGIWDGFNLANGGSATLEIVATVTDHNALNNIATVDADTFDTNAGNDSDNQIVDALDADLSISKAVDNATPNVGDNITFTLTVVNSGPDASNNVSVTDLLPVGFTFVSSNPSIGSYDDGSGVWDGFNLANGGSATLEIVATVTDHNALNNFASVDADTFDPNAGNDTDNQVVNALDADLSISKAVNNATPDVGDNITFTLTVVNSGPDSSNNVSVTDLLPAGFTFVSSNPSVGSYDDGTGVWDGFNLANGANATLEIVATVTDHNALNNIATVDADTFDPNAGNDTDNQIVDALDADLSISKAVNNATPDVGDNITFTLTVVNSGPDASNNISVTDLLPAGFTFVSSNPSVGSYNDGTGIWDGFNLANGGSATLEIVATVTDHNAINNIATVDANTFDPNAANDSDNQIVDALDADLSISKAVNNATPDVGDNITFTLTVVNNGPDASNNISVTDLLPAGFTFVSSNPSIGSYDDGTGVWDGFNLANGGSATLEIVATVTDHNALNNIATVDANTFDPNAANDSDNQIVDALDADLSISKAVNNATPDVGDNITFTLTVVNSGPDTSNNISVTDLLPAGFTFVSSNPSVGSYNDGTGIWDGFNLANGANATLEIVATVTDHNALNNIASVDADTFDPNAANDSDNQIVDALNADLSISKAVDNATPDVGDNITFTLTVLNNGPDISNNVSVTDLLPAGFTFVSSNPSVGSYNDGTGIWDGFSLVNGGSATLEIVATVTDHNALNNIAAVDADTFDTNAGNDSDNQIVDALDADLSISKAVNNATPDVGDNITFTLTVVNSGPDASNNISVTDLLPAGFTFVSSNPSAGSYDDGTGVWDGFNLANGGSATLEIVATVTDHNALNNIASVDADTFDPVAGNDTDNQIVDALDADLSISKAVNNATPDVGDNITFTLTVVNSGPDASNNVSVTDLLPAGFTFVSSNPSVGSYNDGTGVWDGFNLANGGSATLEIVATVTDHNALNNIASVDADTFDPNAGNDTDNQIVDALDADLSISKAVDNATPDVGDNITFTLTVVNSGPDASNNISVTDLLPAGFTFVSSNPSAGSYNDGTGVWDGFNLANGANATLEIVATVTDHNALNNIATVDADTFDPNAANDSDNQMVNALDADISVLKTVDDATPNVGDNITFTLTLMNNGPDPSTNIVLNDLLPAGLAFVSSNPSAGSYDSGTGVWDGFSIANGGSETLEIVATVNSHTALNNVATVTSDTFDPNTGDNTDNQMIDAQDADLSLTKSVDNAAPDVGEDVTFTIVLTNSGPDAASGVTVSDMLPTGVTFVSASESQGSYDDNTGIWTLGSDLASGSSATLDIVATVTGEVLISASGDATNIAQVAAADQFDPDSTPGNNNPAEDDQDSAIVTPNIELVINEIGIANGTFIPDQHFIELYNLGDGAIDSTALSAINVEMIGQSGNIPVAIDLSTLTSFFTVEIPANGFLTLFADGTWVNSDGVGGTYTVPPGAWDFGSDVTSQLAVNLVLNQPTANVLDTFLANRVDRANLTNTGVWNGGGTGSVAAAALLGVFVDNNTFNAMVGDQQSVLDATGLTRPLVGDSPAVAASDYVNIFARVFDTNLDGIPIDNANDQSEWTVTNEARINLLNDFPADNPQDSGNDDFDPNQGAGTNSADAGQTVLEAGVAGAGDNINGGNGPDFLYGNANANLIDGGANNDFLFGDTGNDQLTGGSGADFLVDVSGQDLLVGGSGDDILVTDGVALGGAADGQGDILIGDDVVFGVFTDNSGRDVIIGGDGDDYIFGDLLATTGITQLVTFFNDPFGTIDSIVTDPVLISIINSNGDGDWIDGGAGNDIIFGGAGMDEILGGSGNDIIIAGDGDDWIETGAGADTVDGGAGTGDTVVYSNEASGAIVNLAQPADVVLSTINNANIGGQALTQDDLAAYNQASDSASLLFDGSAFAGGTAAINGAHVLPDGQLLLVINSGIRLNNYTTANSGEVLLYNPINNTTGLLIDFTMFDPGGTIALDGVSMDADGNIYFSTSNSATVDQPDGSSLAIIPNDIYQFDPVTQQFSLFFDASTIFDGGTGNVNGLHILEVGDILLTTAGTIAINGDIYTNGDIVEYDPVNDVATTFLDESLFTGNENINAISLTPNYEAIETGGSAAGDTFVNIENAIGTDFDDTLVGTDSANELTSNAGNDILVGSAGNDTLDGGADNDTVDYHLIDTAVNVNLNTGTATGAGIGADTLSNIENIRGGQGDDTLTGDGSNNVIEGGRGADIIDGGGGNDTASFEHSSEPVYVDLNQANPSIFFSLYGNVNLGGLPVADEDVVEWDGSTFSLFFDGSVNELTAGAEDIRGLFIRDNGNILFTTNNGGTVNGGALSFDNRDIVEWNGEDFSLFLDGSAIGIPGNSGGVGALHVLPNGDIIFSMDASNVNLPGLTNVDDEDLVLYDGTSFHRFFDGSAVNGSLNGEDIDAVSVRSNGNIIFSLTTADTLSGTTFADEDLIEWDGSTFTMFFDASTAAGNLAGQDIGAVHIFEQGDAQGDTYTNIESLRGSAFNDTLIGDNNNNILEGGPGADRLIGNNGSDTASYANASSGVEVTLQPLTFNFALDGGATIGGLSITNEGTLAQYNAGTDVGTQIFDIFGGVEARTILATHSFDDGSYLLSFFDTETNGVITVEPEDVVQFNPTLGTASIFFDGSSVGFSGNIDAFHVLDNGNYVLSTLGNATIGNNGTQLAFDNGDLVEYNPNTDTATLFLDNTDSGNINAVYILSNGNPVVSTGNSGLVNGIQVDADSLVEIDLASGSSTVLFNGDAFSGPTDINAVFIDALTKDGTGDAMGDVFESIENLIGSDFDDSLTGDENNNILVGLDGNDILTTGGGSDILAGGAGNDTFKSSANDSGSDTDAYFDFNAADDILDISELLDNYDAGVDDINDFVNIQNNGDVNVDADGPGAGGQETVANLTTAPTSGTAINVIGESGTTEQVNVV